MRAFSNGGCRSRAALVLALLCAWASPLAAAEIDSLTDRQRPLRDSREALESRLNHALRAGVARANRNATACDPHVLYDAVRDALSSPFIGHWIAEDLDRDVTLDRRRIAREDSIYRDLGWLENPSVHLKDLSSVVRVGDTLFGVDKIGHFFVEGWRYFEIAYLEAQGIEAALDWGERSERTYFGSYTTGLYSSADLVANFEGMRFWLRLAGHAPDPIEPGWLADRPLVACGRRFWIAGERRWRLARELDLSRHVAPVWDEAVNCPAYRTPEIEALVTARSAALALRDGTDYGCPVEPQACAEARQRYGALAPRLLHPACLAAPQRARPRWLSW